MQRFLSATVPFRPAHPAALAQLVIDSHSRRPVLSSVTTTAAVFARSSSMSAIVRGVRRTVRDTPRNMAQRQQREPGYDRRVASRVSERRRAREALPRPGYKILRGKKDITEDPLPAPKTRRARFFDPEDKFGKQSLVYKFKTGQLEEEVQKLEQQIGLSGEEGGGEWGNDRGEDGRDNGNSGRGYERRNNDRRDSGRRDSNQREYGNSWGGDREHRQRPLLRSRENEGRVGRRGYETEWPETARNGRQDWGSRDDRQDRNGWRGERDDRRDDRRGDRQEDRREDRGVDRRNNEWRGNNDSRQADRGNWQDRDVRRDDRRDRGDRSGRDSRSDRGRDARRSEDDAKETPDTPMLLSIPYTTAASQFLYGRSVVEAALRSGRRQLYKLYVHTGAAESTRTDRRTRGRDSQPDDGMERLAQRRGVVVQAVDARGQRLMDKMSKGRPHNGYVLEASPLPQPPVEALGRWTLSGDGPDQAGFPIVVGHQSREDAVINDTAGTFVPTTTPHHRAPLVLLLDQVLDPGNLGAILRTASFLGVSAVAVSRHSSAGLTSVALKASAGAAESLALLSVDEPATFLAQSRQAGWRVYAAVAGGGHKTRDLPAIERDDPLRAHPCVLVLGSEGEGLPRALRREADVEVCIANRSDSEVVDSLNVSVAAALLSAAFLRGTAKGVAGVAGVDESAEPAKDKPAETVAAPEPDALEQAVAAGSEPTGVAPKNDELGLW